MKRKTIYALVMTCFLGFISSANQNNKTTAFCFSEKNKNSVPVTVRAKATTGSQVTPLNLLLFDL